MPAKLYGVPLSPFVRKARIVLEEKNIPYELDPVIPMNVSDEYRQISPLGKVPAYRDNSVTLADSSIISAYLEKAHPQPALYPTEAASYAQALWFEEYVDGGLTSPITTPFMERVVIPNFVKTRNTDENAIKEALEVKLPPMFSYVESQLKQDKWIVGNQFSIADIAIGSVFVTFLSAGDMIDSNKYPLLAAYIAKIHARPSFQKVLQSEKAYMNQSKAA